MNDGSKSQWLNRARRVAWHVNLGWWLNYLLPPALGISVLFSALILIARGQGWPVTRLAVAAAVVMTVTAAAAFFFARRKFFSLPDALVRLEANARLHNRLTCADAGVGGWPEFDAKADAGLGWKWRRIAAPLLASSACIAAALLVPVKLNADVATKNMQEPTSWSQVRQWVQELEKEKALEPQDLEAFKDQVETLKRQPKENWYTHSSLEAGDQLRDQAKQSIQELDRNLELAQSVMNQAMQAEDEATQVQEGKEAKDANATDSKTGKNENDGKQAGQKNGNQNGNKSPQNSQAQNKNGSSLDKATQQALQQQWQKALDGLKSGAMKLDPKTMQQLSKIDPSKLEQLSPQQLQNLKKQLANCNKACQKTGACKSGSCNNPNASALALVQAMSQARGSCTAQFGTPGKGGSGASPLTFNKDETQAGTKNQEGVSSDSMKNAALGDTVAIQNGRHNVDPKDYQGQQTGGNAQAGSAGEAVWKTEVLPEEQAALERYFNDQKK